ncbi:hypothetical protein [Polynucleobacter campilacus]|uniref:DUF4239 domain-containing protein n=1 Tax=Polynucleobacter campilacus TaxID=1743163 RepID=A0A254Q2T1_9BURK|nr:hypothetical protein [Polynucleobacter campilacus]OWS71131.1 hypothetical protein CBI31_02540 [Polynucleobacter campilacus]
MHSFFESNLHIAQYVPFGLIIAIIIFTAIGWSVGLYRLKKYGESGAVIRDSLAAAIFGLSALVLGFTFSGSASRYVDRMDAIRVQAQTLQQVYGSLKYLNKNDQVVVKKSLDDLLDARLTAYKNLIAMSDIDAGGAKIMAATRKIQEDVTQATLNTSSENKAFATGLLTSQVSNLATAFAAGVIDTKSHPPSLLLKFLFALLCIGAFLIGYTMVLKNETDWLLASLYTLLIGISIYVILSLELPNLLMPYEEVNRDLLMLKDTVR